jgi:hypothetical protein
MAYQILEMTLVTRSGRRSTGYAGLVTTKNEMAQFMHDYCADVHDEKWMVLDAPLAREWRNHVNGGGLKLLGGLGQMIGGAVTANPKMFGDGVKDALSPGIGAYFTAEKDPFQRMLVSSRWAVPVHYADDRIGVCVHCLGHYSL